MKKIIKNKVFLVALSVLLGFSMFCVINISNYQGNLETTNQPTLKTWLLNENSDTIPNLSGQLWSPKRTSFFNDFENGLSYELPGSVAIFRNYLAWDTNSIETILNLYGIDYTVYDSSYMGTVDLTQYEKVIIESDQNQLFYDTLGSYISWFESYAANGGILEIHAADGGWNGGYWDGAYLMPGGFDQLPAFIELISINLADHPILLDPNIITDEELDDWSASAHGSFITYPANSKQILLDSNSLNPVFIELDYGEGTILITMQTLEFSYYYGYSNLLENVVLYSPSVPTPSGTILFDEAHLPLYSIGSNPAYDVAGGYSEFAGMLTDAGHTVNTIDPGTVIDTVVLSGCDILVIAGSQSAYTAAELDAIETWVVAGGSVLLITDRVGFGTYMDPLVNRFGFDFKNDCILDSDDGLGTGDSSQLFYDGPNILSHPITTGVSRVESYAGDGLIAAPVDEIPIIITDTDGTATWSIEGTPALGVSFMSAVDDGSAGAGKVVVIGDCNVWDSVYDVDSDGDLDFYDSDNEILAMNTINWLIPTPPLTILFDEAHLPMYSIGSNPAYSVMGGYSEFAGMLTDAGYIVDTIDPDTVIDITVLSGCDILIIDVSQNPYTTEELDAIETWVTTGGSLLLISDWGDLGDYVDPLAARFGFDFKNDCILDSDDGLGTGDSSQLFYDGPNILSHPITAGVTRVEMYAGDGLIAAPGDEIPIIITDTDGTATWYIEGTPALGVSVMSTVDGGSAGAGKVCVIGDGNVWDSAWDIDSDGDLDFYDSDNEILAMNTINWLAPALYDSITVITPDSSSSWETGTTQSITWTSIGSITNVRIELYNEGEFVLEIVAGTANDGEFSWTIPPGLDDSTQYQINISDVSNPDTYDFSDNFEIFTTPEITILSPNSSTSWETESTQSILWNSIGSITDVKIELYKDGVFVLEIVASTPNDGEFSWTIPAGLDDSTQYQINISDVSNPDTYDLSDNFEIFTTPEITVLSPNSSSSWETETTHSILWNSTGSIINVKIELYKDGVFLLEVVASTANDGEFSWTIPAGLDDSTQYQIRVSDVSNPDTYDLSDNFEIFTTPEIFVNSPDSSSSWETGTTHFITWTSTGSITNVKIELYKDGVFVLEIVASTANDGAFSWTIPSGLDDSTQYQINISDVSNPAIYDFSDYFEIFTTPEITVTNPDSSSSWETGTTQSITWTSEGSITDVKINLYKDGVFVLEIVASTANDGDFSWTIPSGLDDSTQYQINISDVSNPDTYDLSEYFEIYTPDSITVTNPDSSSSWETSTSEEITWISTGTISNVKIELYKDGELVVEIIASTTNDGSYTWAIPTDLEDGSDYQIKISDVSNPDTQDFSDNFEIFTSLEEDSLTITNPSTATAWEMGTSHAITWTSTGSITNVKIELFKDGVFVLEIVASTANDGSYTWAIPTDLEDGIDYQIKISDVSNPDTNDGSPNFVITSVPIPKDGGIPSYNFYILIGVICLVSVILTKKRFKFIK